MKVRAELFGGLCIPKSDRRCNAQAPARTRLSFALFMVLATLTDGKVGNLGAVRAQSCESSCVRDVSEDF